MWGRTHTQTQASRVHVPGCWVDMNITCLEGASKHSRPGSAFQRACAPGWKTERLMFVFGLGVFSSVGVCLLYLVLRCCNLTPSASRKMKTKCFISNPTTTAAAAATPPKKGHNWITVYPHKLSGKQHLTDLITNSLFIPAPQSHSCISPHPSAKLHQFHTVISSWNCRIWLQRF